MVPPIMTEPSPSFKAKPRTPRLKLPRGACDTHFHVFGPQKRFPFAADRSYTPTCDAPKETLFAMHKQMGIERGVVVHLRLEGLGEDRRLGRPIDAGRDADRGAEAAR